MNDEQIIIQLRGNKRDKALVKLYRYFPKVEKLILSKGGSKADAQDIFQESLIIFCEKVEDDGFELTSSANTYIYGICRLLWRNELRKRKNQKWSEIQTELNDDAEQELEAKLLQDSRINLIESVLNDLGKRCLELLKLFYYQALSMKDIVKKLDFSSEKIAKNQKYKCMERARKKVQELS